MMSKLGGECQWKHRTPEIHFIMVKKLKRENITSLNGTIKG